MSVKAFLADVRSWAREYRYPDYVCADFADHVCQTAAQKGIKCGYVTIHFRGLQMGHAIVAFNTDYGLKYFEPQSGEEEHLDVGKPYRTRMGGVPEGAIVASVRIKWNDGTTTLPGLFA